MGRERKNEGKGEGGTVWTNDRPCSKIFSVEIEIMSCPHALQCCTLGQGEKIEMFKVRIIFG